MKEILEILGFLLLWIAVSIGRDEKSEIKFFSLNWFIIFILIVFGAFLIKQ